MAEDGHQSDVTGAARDSIWQSRVHKEHGEPGQRQEASLYQSNDAESQGGSDVTDRASQDSDDAFSSLDHEDEYQAACVHAWSSIEVQPIGNQSDVR